MENIYVIFFVRKIELKTTCFDSFLALILSDTPLLDAFGRFYLKNLHRSYYENIFVCKSEQKCIFINKRHSFSLNCDSLVDEIIYIEILSCIKIHNSVGALSAHSNSWWSIGSMCQERARISDASMHINCIAMQILREIFNKMCIHCVWVCTRFVLQSER